MAIVTIVYAVLLIALGVAGYVGAMNSGNASVTALIPAFFGVIFLALGILATKGGSMRKHIMHGAAFFTLLAMLGTFGGIMAVLRMIGGVQPERPSAAVAQSIMFLLATAYLMICINSFIQARKRRKLGESETPNA